MSEPTGLSCHDHGNCELCDYLESLLNDLTSLIGKERDDFGKKETELLSRLKKMEEVLQRIVQSDDHHRMCQLDVHNCVVACNVRRAKEALNVTGG